jgi:hypothetical protein
MRFNREENISSSPQLVPTIPRSFAYPTSLTTIDGACEQIEAGAGDSFGFLKAVVGARKNERVAHCRLFFPEIILVASAAFAYSASRTFSEAEKNAHRCGNLSFFPNMCLVSLPL